MLISNRNSFLRMNLSSQMRERESSGFKTVVFNSINNINTYCIGLWNSSHKNIDRFQ